MGGKLSKKGIRATEDHKDEGDVAEVTAKDTGKAQPVAGSINLQSGKDSQKEDQESRGDSTENKQLEASVGAKAAVQQYTEEGLVSAACNKTDLPHPQEVPPPTGEESRDQGSTEETSSEAQGMRCGETPASDRSC